MAAYTAVISLLQTLQLFNVHTSQPFDSLYATAEYFQHVLEKISKNSGYDPEKIKSLEAKIRDAASEAEDAVELKISPIIKAAWWRFGFSQHHDLRKVVKKMDTTKKQVMEILSHDANDQVLELSGDSMIGTSSTSNPMLEDDIVRGLDDDLEIIVKRLTGPPRDLDVVTISGMGGIGKTTLARKAYDHLTIRIATSGPVNTSRLTKLETFKLEGLRLLGSPIREFVFPTSLRRLSLRRCSHFDWEDISSIVRMLPNLEELKLKDCQASGYEWRLSDDDKFKSLKLLLLSGSSLTRWEASSDNFPNLKRLVLKECRSLQEIPADFGEICTLESIELHDCSTTAEASARNIVQEQEEMGNNSLKVFIHNNRRKWSYNSPY